MSAVLHTAVLTAAIWWAASLLSVALFAAMKHKPEPLAKPLVVLMEARAIVWAYARRERVA